MEKILLVDDEEMVLRLLETALKSEGYNTMVCQKADDALRLLKSENFDLMITDIRMPEKDGMQLVEEMRDMGVNIPVIAISGDKGDEKADDYLDFAIYFTADALKKPIKKDDLLSAVRLSLGPSVDEALLYL
jgi:two-component system response regulator GlrR